MKQSRNLVATALLLAAVHLVASDLTSAEVSEKTAISCANLIYAGSQTSVCFSDRFLTRVATETSLRAAKKFTPVKLGSAAVFDHPIAVISGEGTFRFTAAERQNLRQYLSCGGFLLASPGCSDKEWDRAFRRELEQCLPNHRLVTIPMSHQIFSMVYQVPQLTLKGGGSASLEGVEIEGRLALVYSPEGLNDIEHAKGCCCCGGDQIRECERVNVNIFTYALLF